MKLNMNPILYSNRFQIAYTDWLKWFDDIEYKLRGKLADGNDWHMQVIQVWFRLA